MPSAGTGTRDEREKRRVGERGWATHLDLVDGHQSRRHAAARCADLDVLNPVHVAREGGLVGAPTAGAVDCAFVDVGDGKVIVADSDLTGAAVGPAPEVVLEDPILELHNILIEAS
jgi:hypothetical protein